MAYPLEVVLRSQTSEPTPLVSVVVSTRNHAQFLPATVAAVSAQDLPGVELVVADNASTDDTEAIMRGAVRNARIPITYRRLERDLGPAEGRNAAMEETRGQYVAFIDSDCVPSPGWLRSALAAFRPGVGIVQGRTECAASSAPFFSHFIETPRFDGSFSTSNVVYARDALGNHLFDPGCWYWEDTDLGWRVLNDGWEAVFSPDALVRHQVVPISPLRWVLWPTRYRTYPAKAARYPRFRRHLFLGLWVRPLHAAFDLALLGIIASRRAHGAALLTVPYATAFVATRGLRGRSPVVKIALYVVRDLVALASLVVSSVKHRSVVL